LQRAGVRLGPGDWRRACREPSWPFRGSGRAARLWRAVPAYRPKSLRESARPPLVPAVGIVLRTNPDQGAAAGSARLPRSRRAADRDPKARPAQPDHRALRGGLDDHALRPRTGAAVLLPVYLRPRRV